MGIKYDTFDVKEPYLIVLESIDITKSIYVYISIYVQIHRQNHDSDVQKYEFVITLARYALSVLNNFIIILFLSTSIGHGVIYTCYLKYFLPSLYCIV